MKNIPKALRPKLKWKEKEKHREEWWQEQQHMHAVVKWHRSHGTRHMLKGSAAKGKEQKAGRRH